VYFFPLTFCSTQASGGQPGAAAGSYGTQSVGQYGSYDQSYGQSQGQTGQTTQQYGQQSQGGAIDSTCMEGNYFDHNFLKENGSSPETSIFSCLTCFTNEIEQALKYKKTLYYFKKLL